MRAEAIYETRIAISNISKIHLSIDLDSRLFEMNLLAMIQNNK
jgi:hypothetical protein